MADDNIDPTSETWKPIPGHPGYEASDQGQIRSVRRWVVSPARKRVFPGKVLRQFTLWNGYKTIHLGKNLMNIYVHRLVALAFLGPMPHGLEICHNDGDKTNNLLSNLRYDTRAANMADRKKHVKNPKQTKRSS